MAITPLEERLVLSATAVIDGDVLKITSDGDPLTQNETVQVHFDEVTNLLELRDENNAIIQIDGFDNIDISSITEIHFDLGDGDDTITLPVISGLQTTVLDGAGQDVVNLSGEATAQGTGASLAAETINLQGSLSFTGSLELTGAVFLHDNGTGDVTITTGAGSSSFLNGSLQGQTGTESLVINAAGADWQFSGTVSQLQDVTITTAQDVLFQDQLTLSGEFVQQAGTGSTFFQGDLSASNVSLTTSDLQIGGDIDVQNGTLTLVSDTIEIQTSSTLTAHGGIWLQTLTSNQTIELGGTVDTGVNYTLTEAELHTLHSTGQVTIGAVNYSGSLEVNGWDLSGESFHLALLAGSGSQVSFLEALNLGSNHLQVQSPSTVLISAPILATGAAQVQIQAGRVNFEQSGSITTGTGDIILEAGEDLVFAQNQAAVLTTGGGSLLLTADADNNASGSILVHADSTFQITAGNGGIVLNGPVTTEQPLFHDLTLMTTTGAIILNNPVEKLDTLQIQSLSGEITFAAAIDAIATLNVTTNGNIIFHGDLGSNTALGSVTLSGSGTTVFDKGSTQVVQLASAEFGQQVELQNDITLSATGDVEFVNAVVGQQNSMQFTAMNDLTFSGTVSDLDTLQIDMARDVVFQSAVTLSGELLQTDGTGTTRFSGAIAASQISVQTDQILVQADLTTETGSVTLTAADQILIDARIDTTLAGATGTIFLMADQLIEFTTQGSLLAEAEITVLADEGTPAATGQIVMADGASIESTALIQMAAAGDLEIAHVASSSTDQVAIELKSRLGGILDGGDSRVNLQTPGGVLLEAATGIGSANALETDISQLQAVNTGSGNIAIEELNGLEVLEIRQQGTGDVTLETLAGSLQIAGAGISAAGGAVQLEATGGAVEIASEIQTLGGNLTILADTGVSTHSQGILQTTGTAGSDSGAVSIEVRQTGEIHLGQAILTTGAANLSGTGGAGGNVTLLTADGAIHTGQLELSGGNGSGNGGAAGNLEINAQGGDIVLNQQITALGGTGTVAGGDGLVDLTTTASLLDGNDGQTEIIAGLFSAVAGQQIGEITDFEQGLGNAIDLRLTGQLLKAEVTGAGGEIHLRQTGNLQAATGAIVVDADGAARAVIIATGSLDLGSHSGAVVASAGDQLHFQAGDQLILPDAGLNVGDGQLVLTGINDIVDASGRELGVLQASWLMFLSGSAGGDTVLNTEVAELSAELTGAGRSLMINEHDALTVNRMQTVDGNITINAAQGAAGDITLTAMNAGQGTVLLDTLPFGGGIIDGGDTETDITAAALAIRATTGIADNDQLEIAVQDLAANTVTGSIHLLNTVEALNITTVAGVSGVAISGGSPGSDIEIYNEGTLQVLEAVSNHGGGHLLLSAFAADSSAELIVAADITATGGDGEIMLVSASHLQVEQSAQISTTGLGDILLTAGENRPDGNSAQNGSAMANLLLANGTSLQSAAGDITLRATGDVLLSTVSTSGDITVQADFDGVSGGLADGQGGIFDNTVSEQANLTGSRLTLAAASGIGNLDSINTDVSEVTVSNTTSGAIQIEQTAGSGDNPLTVQDISNAGGLIDVQTADGDLMVVGTVQTEGAGSITLIAGDSDNDGNGNLQISGLVSTENGKIHLESAGSDVLFTAAAEVHSSGSGEISVIAGQTGAGVIAMTDGSLITSGTGDISLTAPGDITLGQITTGSASQQAILLETGGAVIDGGDSNGADLQAEAGGLVIRAEQGIGSGNALETAVGLLLLENGTAGNIEIQEASDVALTQITQSGVGAVTISSQGPLTLITGAGIELQGGPLFLYASGADSDLILQADIETHGGSAQLWADRHVLLEENVAILTGNGNLAITADSSGGQTAASGDLRMAATSRIDAGSGQIDLQAAGEVRITQVETETLLTVTSTHGGITDAGDVGSFDLSAQQLALRAAQGIGTDNPLEINVALLSASNISPSNTDSGSIRLHNSGHDLQIGNVAGLTGIQQSGNTQGSIEIQNDGTIEINSSVLNAAGGGITFTADSGLGLADIVVNAPVAAAGPAGHILFEAERHLLLNDTGAFIDILGTSITGRAGETVTVADDVIIQSSTGAVIQSLPLLQNIVTPQVQATGEASVSGDFGRLNELNFYITIDWADGTVQTLQHGENTPSSFHYTHQYFGNPDISNPAAPIPITVSIADDENISFWQNGVEMKLDPVVSFADVPGEGLASGIVFDLSVDVPDLGTTTTISVETIDLQTSQTVETQEQSDVETVVEETELSEERIVKLRVFNAAGEIQEEITLTGEQALSLLNDFIGFVEAHKLPDGRYQILQQEPGEQTLRVVYDLLLRNGRPADNSEGLQDRPPTSDGAPPAAAPLPQVPESSLPPGEQKETRSSVQPLQLENSTPELTEIAITP